MIIISKKILRLDRKNGVFIIFGDYDSEVLFNDFLSFIKEKIGAEVGDVIQHPYSISATVKFPFGEATAIYQGGIGCAIRVDTEKDIVVTNLVAACSGI